MKTIVQGILYFFGLGENPITYKMEDDVHAMKSDWENVGRDFHSAIKNYGEQR